jgi:hypothetical protein
MPIELKTGSVSVRLPTGDGTSLLEARMFGYPVSISGRPALVEVLIPEGRTTLAKISDVTPLDDAARALLAGRPREHV